MLLSCPSTYSCLPVRPQRLLRLKQEMFIGTQPHASSSASSHYLPCLSSTFPTPVYDASTEGCSGPSTLSWIPSAFLRPTSTASPRKLLVLSTLTSGTTPSTPFCTARTCALFSSSAVQPPICLCHLPPVLRVLSPLPCSCCDDCPPSPCRLPGPDMHPSQASPGPRVQARRPAPPGTFNVTCTT